MTTLQEDMRNLYNVGKSLIDNRAAYDANVDAAIANMKATALMPSIAYYDAQTVSKTSIAATASATDASVSNWLPVPNTKQNHFYPIEGKLTLVRLRGAYSYYPGYYESPQYATDKSRTYMQFVFANDAITSDEIDARLAIIKKVPDNCGSWGDGTSTAKAVAVINAAKHPYSRLYVRFINKVINGDGSPQNIVTYGGNASFMVDSVLHFPSLED